MQDFKFLDNSNVSKVVLIINLSVPLNPIDYFNLLSINYNNLESTITFVTNNDTKENCSVYLTSLIGLKQEIPSWFQEKCV